MLLSNNEEFQAVRITVTGEFEEISLDRTQQNVSAVALERMYWVVA